MKIKKYQFFEKIRSINPAMGGGLCIGVNKKLPSALLRDGGDEVECLTVQVELGLLELVVVCGYGSQENAGRRTSGSSSSGRSTRLHGRKR